MDHLGKQPIKDTNPKTVYGQAKPSIGLIPGSALLHIADAFADGAAKYGPANWRTDPVSTSTYINAAYRHILAYFDGREASADDSGTHHLGHAAACLAIIMDAEEQGTLVDDRPPAGKSPQVIKALTKKID